VPDYEEAPIFDQDWDIVLLDHEPPPRRGVDALRLRARCRLMTGHDSQHPASGYAEARDTFKYRFTESRIFPWTTVVSDEPLDWLEERSPPHVAEYLAELFPRHIQTHYGLYQREELSEAARRAPTCAYLADDDHGPLASQEILLAGCPTVGVRTGAWLVKPGETGVLVDRLLPGRQCVETDADRAVLEIYPSAIQQAQELDRYGVRQGASRGFSTESTINCLIDASNTVRSSACEDTSFTT
jgi:hypothetical protein